MGALDSLLAGAGIQPQPHPTGRGGSLARLLGTQPAEEDGLGAAEAVLSGPEYGAAGFLDSLLSGENPLEGIQRGIDERTEFGDVLRKRGVPEPIAVGGGFLAAAFNPADPLNYIPLAPAARGVQGIIEGLLKRGKGGMMFRAMESVKAEALKGVRSISEIHAATPDLASARAALESKAGSAAATTFAEIMGTETRDTAPELFARAKEEAAKAAAGVRNSRKVLELNEASDPLLLGTLSQRLLDKLGHVPAVAKAADLLHQGRRSWNWYGRNLGDWMRSDPSAWGEVGPKLAGGIEQTTHLTAQYEGQFNHALDTKVLRGLNHTERENLVDVLAMTGRPTNQKVADAAEAYKSLRQQVAADAHAVGVMMEVPETHNAGQIELFDDWMREKPFILPSKKGGEARTKRIPFQERHTDAVYKIRSERMMNALARSGSAEREAAIKKLLDEHGAAVANTANALNAAPESVKKLSKREAAEAIIDDLVGSRHEPLDIMRGPLQHSRNDLLDALGVPWERDPDKWMRLYFHNVSKTVAAHKVFGGELSGLKAMRELAPDKKLFDDTMGLFFGHPTPEQARGSGLYHFLRNVQVLRLGPRVGALQFLQLANTQAMFGSANTGRAMGSLLRARAEGHGLASAAEVVGALLPSTHLSYDTEPLSGFAQWWIRKMTAMPIADRYVRTVSAMAGGFQARELAQQLPTAAGAKRRIITKRLYDLGVDAQEVLAKEGRLTLQQMQTAMERGSYMTQFGSGLLDLPASVRSNNFYRTMNIFRSFAKQQSAFANRLIRQARQGDFAPLARYLSSFVGIYNQVEPVLRALQGRDDSEEDEGLWKVLSDYLYVGMLGSFGDVITAGAKGDSGQILKQQVGPVIGTAADLQAAAAKSTAEGDMSVLGWQLARSFGPAGSGTLLRNLTSE